MLGQGQGSEGPRSGLSLGSVEAPFKTFVM
jgi:hypothetical protein